MLDIFDYIKEGEGSRHEIADTKLVDKVREVNPGIIAICVCYSHLSQIHLILSEAGILSVQKLERDLQLSTKGRCIELDDYNFQIDMINFSLPLASLLHNAEMERLLTLGFISPSSLFIQFAQKTGSKPCQLKVPSLGLMRESFRFQN